MTQERAIPKTRSTRVGYGLLWLAAPALVYKIFCRVMGLEVDYSSRNVLILVSLMVFGLITGLVILGVETIRFAFRGREEGDFQPEAGVPITRARRVASYLLLLAVPRVTYGVINVMRGRPIDDTSWTALVLHWMSFGVFVGLAILGVEAVRGAQRR